MSESSDSRMDEGSIGAGSENEYEAYDLEEEREDYDEAGEEEEDDEDEDDSGEELPFEFAESMAGFMDTLHLREPATGTAEIHFAEVHEGAPRGAFGVLSLGHGHHDHSPRFDNSTSFLHFMQQNAAAAMHHDPGSGPGHHVMPMSAFPSRPSDDPTQRVHPALARPRSPNPSAAINSLPNFLDNPSSFDVYFSNSPLAHSGYPGTRVELDHNPMASNSNGPRRSNPLDDAVSSLASLVNIISPDDAPDHAPVSEPGNGSTQTSQAQLPSNADTNVVAPTNDTQLSQSLHQQVRANAANDNDEIMPQAQRALPVTNPEAFAAHLAQISMAMSESIPPHGSPMEQQFFLPSQMAAHMEIMEGPSGMMHVPHGFPFGPTIMSRRVGRPLRERERTSTSRRWAYDPPGNGGDDLPSMFTGESVNQRNQTSHFSDRRNPTNPFAIVAAESFDSVNALEKDVINRISQLTSDLYKIDKKANEVISEAKKKKEDEEKAKKAEAEKAKEEEAKAEEESKEEKAHPDAAASETNIVEDHPPVAMHTEGDDERSEAPATADRNEHEAQTANTEPVAAANDGDIEVVDVDADENANQEQNSQSENTEGQVEGSGNAEGGVSNEQFPSLAAARAAAIGISLDAPANEDPTVIQAACDSTGIDPTFLAALPAEMRSEVFNQLFESMSNAAPAPTGTSGQPASTINQDFLVALPPALRAQVLVAEVEYQTRNNAQASNQGGNASNGSGNNNAQGSAPGDQMDNATFLATLAPDLREEILITSGEEFIRSLPSHLAAEARTLRERDAANQMHQHHGGWDGPDDPGPMIFRRNLYGAGRRGRDTVRESRRDEYGMRWEKKDNYWYRVGPKEENEIKSSLNDDALKSVVRLLKLNKNTQTRSAVYLVLKSACKNSKARKRVLSELLTMITCEKEKDTGATSDDPAVYASEGTIVRRALELLNELCKADMSVAEALIGLPSPPIKSPDAEEILSSEPVVDKLLSLSTLTSLLSTPLFLRSNVHLEQLLNVISLVCRAFPSSRPSKIGSGSSRRNRGHSVSALQNLLHHMDRYEVDDDDDDDDDEFGRPPRRLMEHLEESHMFVDRELSLEDAERHHVISINMDDGPYLTPSHFEVRRRRRISAPASDDSSEGEQDENSGNQTQSCQASQNEGEAPVGSNEEANNNNGESNNSSGENEIGLNADEGSGGTEADGKKKDKEMKKKKKKPEIRIPAEYRVPKLSEEDLNALVIVLRRANCKEQIYEQVSNSLGQLGELPANRSITIAALANSAQDLGITVKEAYIALKKELEPRVYSNEKDVRKKQIISKFALGTSSSELMLLRLVKTAAALLNISVKKEKPSSKSKKTEKPALDPKCLAELRESKDQVFRSLQDVWISLYEVLDLVESELETVSADKKKEGLRRNSRRNEGLARQTRTRNSRKSLTPILARLSPTIEALFITHSTLIDAEDETTAPLDVPQSPRPMSPRDNIGSPMNTSSTNDSKDAYLDSESSKFRQLGAFLSRHRVPVNALLRVNPLHLETSFKLALKHPHTIDFDNKQAYFRSLIKRRSSEAHASTLRINVRRDYVYTDSHQQLRKKSEEEMKGRLHVQFVGEEGIDAGGVTREWYTIMARQIFDANYALFCRSAAKAATYQPDKRSYVNEEHLENFKFVGRFVAKAIFDGQHIDAYFTRAFYKHILGIKPTYRDIEAQDPDFYNSLKWMLENDITGVLDNTMSAEYEEFGQRKVVDLIPNGRNVQVTEENKAEYVRAVTEVRLTRAIEKQIEAFKEGFHELIPLEDCKIFNELELELVMSGLPDIDMGDLKANVEYTGYTSSSPQINWFWRCVSQMDQEDLARLVMFVTGTSKVPLEGFSALQGMNGAQKFQIHRVAGDTSRLPSAHTCFNQLDLPEYSSPEVLAERLLKAVRECNVGFGFA